jgi:hypothetical protein
MSAPGLLDRLAGTLLPGNAHWPDAGALALTEQITEIAGLRADSAAVLAAFEQRPPAGLASDDGEARVRAVAELEREDPATFGVLRSLVYEAYYRDSRVQQRLAERSGWRPGPAQPAGYLEVFRRSDAPDVSGVIARGITWRDDGSEVARAVRAEQEKDQRRTWTEKEISSWRQ